MDMTYKEKSVAGMLLIALITNFYYFQEVWVVYSTEEPRLGDLLPIIFFVIMLTIVLEIAYEILIASMHQTDEMQEDERDKVIERRGGQAAGYVLAAGVYICVGHILFNDFMDQVDETTIFVVTNLLIFSLSLSELVKGAIQLASYRRGY